MSPRSTPRLFATLLLSVTLTILGSGNEVMSEAIIAEPAKPAVNDTSEIRIDTTATGDSVKVAVPLGGENEPLGVGLDTVIAARPDTMPPVIINVRTTPITDSLLALLFAGWQASPEFPDLPQHTSRWQLDPHFFRLSVGMWGDFETFYPLGMAPSYLSRSDNLAGDQSFANPVPIPGSEEFIRSEPDDAYYFLTPGLSGIYSPFGRAMSVRQRRDLADYDTARTEVFVTRGRGAFSNTAFRFQNYFGSLGNLNADGTFQKTNGLFFGSDSKLDRLRFVVQPDLDVNLETSLLFSLSRLSGGRIFFSDGFNYDGFHTENYNVLSLATTYYAPDQASYSARITYKNDDQKFDSGTLRTAQLFRTVEGSAWHQRAVGNQLLTLGGDLRFLRYTQQAKSTTALYYNVYGSNLWTLTERLQVYGHGALRGSEDLKPDPSVTGILSYRANDRLNIAGVVSHAAVIPQPEMQYIGPITASFDGDTLVDYHLLGNEELETGLVESIEAILNWSSAGINAQLRGGLNRLGDVAAWQVDYDSLTNGTFQAVELDRNLLFATMQTRIRLTDRLRVDAGFGMRQVVEDEIDHTHGPASTGSVVGWYVLPFRKLKLDITVGAGGKFRSDGNPYLVGNGDDAVFLTDSYLSFDLKKFHFFFNFTNVFDLYYTLNGLQQPGRSVWWGFNWALDN